MEPIIEGDRSSRISKWADIIVTAFRKHHSGGSGYHTLDAVTQSYKHSLKNLPLDEIEDILAEAAKRLLKEDKHDIHLSMDEEKFLESLGVKQYTVTKIVELTEQLLAKQKRLPIEEAFGRAILSVLNLEELEPEEAADFVHKDDHLRQIVYAAETVLHIRGHKIHMGDLDD